MSNLLPIIMNIGRLNRQIDTIHSIVRSPVSSA